MQYVYLVRCGDGSIYTGYTTDVERRLAEHREGRGAKYTRGRTPLDLRRVEAYETRSAAQSREAAVKSLSHDQKTDLLPVGEDRIALGGIWRGNDA